MTIAEAYNARFPGQNYSTAKAAVSPLRADLGALLPINTEPITTTK